MRRAIHLEKRLTPSPESSIYSYAASVSEALPFGAQRVADLFLFARFQRDGDKVESCEMLT